MSDEVTIVHTEPRRTRPETWLSAASSLLLRIALAVALAYVLYRAAFIIIVVFVAAMLSFTMAPAVDWLMRTRIFRPVPIHARRTVATWVVFLAFLFALVQLGFWIIKPISVEISNLLANWGAYQAEWARRAAVLQDRYNQLPQDVRDWIEQHGFSDIGAGIPQRIQHVLSQTVHSGMIIVEMILIPVLAFSFLTESRPLKREFTMMVPRQRVRDALHLMRQVGLILQSYAIGQLILALIAGVFTWVLLVSMSVKYPLAMAVVAAITRVIPVIGPVIGAVPIVLLSSLQGWDRGIAVLVAFSFMHLIESKVIMPRVIGHQIKLHPAVVIIVLLLGAEFFGMWGMFLAAPAAAVVKTLVHHFLVRPRMRGRRPPSGPSAGRSPSGSGLLKEEQEERLERPAVAGVRSHSGAH